ncbi:MAG: CRISPR-associated endonuclease Cas2 [Planctomycetota bacterium]|nr:CRISPR-associated endonuclease Cas2 [Planctomycetota bacterium]
MRFSYLIAYDIVEPKRWRKVYRILRGVGDPIQYSLFHAELSKMERVLLLEKLLPWINEAHDRLMLVNLGVAQDGFLDEKRIEWYGSELLSCPDQGPYIV